MNGFTRIFLVLLRLCIGWHFLFEGIEKIESIRTGPTETSKPFSSAGYLREANGPLGEFFRRQVGDLDENALDRLTLRGDELSPELVSDWQGYVHRFAAHYEFDNAQLQAAEGKLAEAKTNAVKWLRDGDITVERNWPGATVNPTIKVPERIKEYRDKLRQARAMENTYLPAFEYDVLKQKLRTAKADAAKMRTELLAALDKPLKDGLASIELTSEQKQIRTPVPPAAPSSKQQWMDNIVAYGLTAVGACLLLGLFTRLSCLLGAAFLCSLYLAMPAFPWLPEPLKTEGHYLFINKNLIEMLALLALATTRSGRWFGIDGLVRCLLPWNWRRAPAPAPTGRYERVVAASSIR
jgi:uncharacterized membrane protein YphA (DoxX/SURF4 family)